MTTTPLGAQLIARERARQVDAEGYDQAHDDAHTGGVLADAAIAYAFNASTRMPATPTVTPWERDTWWPFDPAGFKPADGNPIRDLVRAGALIAAEIDRLLRTDAIDQYVTDIPDATEPIEGLTNAHSPDTAHVAARTRQHRIKWGNDRTMVLNHLCECGPQTAAALAERLPYAGSRNQVAARLLELRQMGLVEYVRTEAGYMTATTGPGAFGRVQAATPQGVLARDRAWSAFVGQE